MTKKWKPENILPVGDPFIDQVIKVGVQARKQPFLLFICQCIPKYVSFSPKQQNTAYKTPLNYTVTEEDLKKPFGIL